MINVYQLRKEVCSCIFIGQFNEILTNTTKCSSRQILGIWAQNLHQIAWFRCNCVHLPSAFIGLGYFSIPYLGNILSSSSR